jgi:hypothetical protein
LPAEIDGRLGALGHALWWQNGAVNLRWGKCNPSFFCLRPGDGTWFEVETRVPSGPMDWSNGAYWSLLDNTGGDPRRPFGLSRQATTRAPGASAARFRPGSHILWTTGLAAAGGSRIWVLAESRSPPRYRLLLVETGPHPPETRDGASAGR